MEEARESLDRVPSYTYPLLVVVSTNEKNDGKQKNRYKVNTESCYNLPMLHLCHRIIRKGITRNFLQKNSSKSTPDCFTLDFVSAPAKQHHVSVLIPLKLYLPIQRKCAHGKKIFEVRNFYSTM